MFGRPGPRLALVDALLGVVVNACALNDRHDIFAEIADTLDAIGRFDYLTLNQRDSTLAAG